MQIAAVDNRTLSYHTGGAPAANLGDIPNQIASGGSGHTPGQIASGGTASGGSGYTPGQIASGGSGYTTGQTTSGGLVDIISQTASAHYSVFLTNNPVSASAPIQLELFVQRAEEAAADDPPKVVSNDDLSRALEAARTRGRALVAKLLRGKDMLTADEFAKLMRVTRVTLDKKQKRQEILALEGAGQGLRFPKWQIGEDGKPFRALPELFDRLGGNPWTVYRFLVQHHPELNGLTGVEALQRGRTNRVLDAAESTLTAAS